jgi:hypothetical protein
MFSRKYGPVWNRWPRRIWAKLTLKAGPAVPPEQVVLEDLRQRVVELRGPAK